MRKQQQPPVTPPSAPTAPIARRITAQSRRDMREDRDRARIASLATRDDAVRARRRNSVIYDGETGAVVSANPREPLEDQEVYDALGDEDAFVGDDEDAYDEDGEEDDSDEEDDEPDGEPYEDEDGDVVYSSSGFARPAPRVASSSRRVSPPLAAAPDYAVPSRVNDDEPPPPPPTAMPVEMSEWINLGGTNRAFDGWYIKCCVSVSLNVMRQAERMNDEIRRARQQAQARGVKVNPRIRVEVVQDLLRDIVMDWNFVDQYGRALPKPPHGLGALRGNLLIATFQTAVESLNVSKPNARRSTRR